jgi:hypothetical protein
MPYINNPIEELSIYTHDKMSEKIFSFVKIFCEEYLSKFIATYDLFCQINTFINYKNEAKDNYFYPESELVDLELLLNMVGVINQDHIAIFEDIVFNFIDLDETAKDRAVIIYSVWQEKALELHRSS